MDYKTKQDELDVAKWTASERKGADACGDFDYCAHCDKTAEYPCAKANEKAAKAVKAKTTAAKKAAVKTAVKKTGKK